jgi:hypothetical protein
MTVVGVGVIVTGVVGWDITGGAITCVTVTAGTGSGVNITGVMGWDITGVITTGDTGICGITTGSTGAGFGGVFTVKVYSVPGLYGLN